MRRDPWYFGAGIAPQQDREDKRMSATVVRTAKKLVFGGAVSSVLALLAASCGQIPGAPNIPGGPAKCPDLSKPETILQADFAGTFKLDAQTATKLRAATAAAIDLKLLAEQIDADLKAGCAPIAKDLGATGDFKDGKSACEAAAKAIGDFKAKLGANAKVTLVTKPPKCEVAMNAMADCGAKCDASVQGPNAKVECEPGKLSGSCDAKCSGSCEVSGGAKCEGECSGSCDAEIKGSCSGTCNGKCDGKDSKATCAGTCEGKCEGGKVKAECKGKCGGECKLKAEAKCEGTCTGKCSAEMKAPKCTGEVTPPKMSAECKGHCDADVSAKAECKPAQVGVAIVGAADASAAGKLKATLEANLPLVLKVAIGMAERVGKVAASVQVVIDGAQATITDVTAKGGAGAALTTGQLGACLGGAFKGAASAAGSIKANVNVSVNVQASATASGSAGGSAGGKTAE